MTTYEACLQDDYLTLLKEASNYYMARGDVFAEHGGMRVIPIEKLIELKLASGMSAPHRLRDLADVQDLITTLSLPVEFAESLDPSVRETYRQLWKDALGDSKNDTEWLEKIFMSR